MSSYRFEINPCLGKGIKEENNSHVSLPVDFKMKAYTESELPKTRYKNCLTRNGYLSGPRRGEVVENPLGGPEPRVLWLRGDQSSPPRGNVVVGVIGVLVAVCVVLGIVAISLSQCSSEGRG
ncbi:unnamed protein product [Nezara viridula]|uniref:Uncharacterized protein n=1 Tax=Nezara viridula TaxID=85310 RepID=A0A9P0H6W3_NEZVI|nr:unnamed protein product [Nezara viridula]